MAGWRGVAGRLGATGSRGVAGGRGVTGGRGVAGGRLMVHWPLMSTDEQDRELLNTIHLHDGLARQVACMRARLDRWAGGLERTAALLKQRGSGLDIPREWEFPSSHEVLRAYADLRKAESDLSTLKNRERQIRGV